jgi:hypothetical protein
VDQITNHPPAVEDRIVFFALALTWPIYLIGGLYVLGPVLAVGLSGLLCLRFYVSGSALNARAVPSAPIGVWVWALGMLFMLVALEVAHAREGLGLGQTIKSTIGWAKGWALFALFPLIGACMNVRLETVLRGAGFVALGTLLTTPILLAAPALGLPEVLFVSPLKVVGGPGPEFFAVQLYSVEPTDGSSRWRFFTPWSPAAGLIGNMFLIFALAEPRKFWKTIGIAAALSMIVLSKSRLAMAGALFIWPTVVMLKEVRRPALWFLAAVGLLALTPFIQLVLDTLDNALNSVKSMRADSTRVREVLGEIALERWWTEAPLWGHGVVERGPHLVEYMPIGSHHTWYGLLFVKGAVGAIALMVPLAWSLVEFSILTVLRSRAGQVSLAMTILMVFYSIGENLEILAYLMWPGLLVMGIAMRELAETRGDEKA